MTSTPEPPTPALSRGTLDRHGPERADEAWLDAAWSGAQLLVLGDGNVTAVRYGSIDYGTATGPRPADALYLGGDATGQVFAVRGTPAGRTADLRAVGADLDRDAGALAHAVGLANWHETHTHCPRCGARDRSIGHGGSQRDCPVDGRPPLPADRPGRDHAGPRRGGRAALPAGPAGVVASRPLLVPGRVRGAGGVGRAGRRSARSARRAASSATAVRYGSSQPWPFPASLMLGYYAVADPTAPVAPTDGELEDAQWFERSGVLDGSVLLPAAGVRCVPAHHELGAMTFAPMGDRDREPLGSARPTGQDR